MTTYIALLRGINIGAKKRIRMADLKALVEGLGFTNVQTYVNSGNVVFDSATRQDDTHLADQIAAALNTRHKLDVPVVVRSAAEMARIVANNPFPNEAEDHKTVHVAFLGEVPASSLVDALADVDKGDDDYRVVGKDIYLHYPNKMSGAVFMPMGFDKALKVISTSRNWRTVVTLAEMASSRATADAT